MGKKSRKDSLRGFKGVVFFSGTLELKKAKLFWTKQFFNHFARNSFAMVFYL